MCAGHPKCICFENWPILDLCWCQQENERAYRQFSPPFFRFCSLQWTLKWGWQTISLRNLIHAHKNMRTALLLQLKWMVTRTAAVQSIPKCCHVNNKLLDKAYVSVGSRIFIIIHFNFSFASSFSSSPSMRRRALTSTFDWWRSVLD